MFLKQNKINTEDTENEEAFLVGDDSKRQMPFSILAAQRKYFKQIVK